MIGVARDEPRLYGLLASSVSAYVAGPLREGGGGVM